MYCEKCGAELKAGDKFCGNCGNVIGEVDTNLSKDSLIKTYSNGAANSNGINLNVNGVVNILKTYIKKPLTIFDEFEDKIDFSSSIIIAVLIPVIYGLLYIAYTSVIIKGLISNVKNIPNQLANIGMMTQEEAFEYTMEMDGGMELMQVETQLKNFINNGQIFKYAFLFLLALIAVTLIAVVIVNKLLLNNELSKESMVFVVAISYIPFVISFILQIVIGYFSLNFSMIMLPLGFALSIITLFKGLSKYSKVAVDKVFLSTGIIIIFNYIVISFVTQKVLANVMSKYIYMLDAMENMF